MADIKKLADKVGDEASQILRAMVSNAPSYVMVPMPMLSWYLRRRQLDLIIAEENAAAPEEEAAIVDDIVMLEQALATQENAANETAH